MSQNPGRMVARKLIRELNKLDFDSDKFLELMGVQIPYVESKPRLSDFGLSELDLVDIDTFNRKMETARTKRAWLFLCSLCILGGLVSFYSEFAKGRLPITSAILNTFAGIVVGLFVGGIGFMVIREGKLPITENHKRLNEYTEAKRNYEYWSRKKLRDYWQSLSGHEFEEALAQVFRKNGYFVSVSKQGGDGGVDLTLQRDKETILVQCKAHKKPIGPAAARDLFGTMQHFQVKEGILASVSGFTDGVHKYVENKPIRLLSLNDILKMIDN
jgi:hypothetical protein